jgi:hypothetical protein
MNVLDENISDDQRQLLRSWGILTRQIGQNVGRKGMPDDAIIPLLRELTRPTFFTRDDGFDRRDLCHAAYCLVYLSVGETEVASFVRRFLRHPACATFTRRRGTVVRVRHTGIQVWRSRHTHEEAIPWPD